jgi:hypothetical protein
LDGQDIDARVNDVEDNKRESFAVLPKEFAHHLLRSHTRPKIEIVKGEFQRYSI